MLYFNDSSREYLLQEKYMLCGEQKGAIYRC